MKEDTYRKRLGDITKENNLKGSLTLGENTWHISIKKEERINEVIEASENEEKLASL